MHDMPPNILQIALAFNKVLERLRSTFNLLILMAVAGFLWAPLYWLGVLALLSYCLFIKEFYALLRLQGHALYPASNLAFFAVIIPLGLVVVLYFLGKARRELETNGLPVQREGVAPEHLAPLQK